MATDTTTGGARTYGVASLAFAGTAGIIVGAAIGAVLFGAGDEPPIWVKNGSISIELLHNSKEWREDGSKANWKISDGTRANDAYQVVISPSDPSNCTGDLKPTTGTITFEYSDSAKTQIEFKAAGKHTRIKVQPAQDLTRSTDKRTLSLDSADGYIAKIQAGQTSCTFSAKDQNLAVALLDR